MRLSPYYLHATFLLIILVAPTSVSGIFAQAPSTPAQTLIKSPVVQSADVVALSSDNQVSSSISVDSVLLPYRVANRTFGGEVADNYAVVQITISNHNPSAELIIHSALLDYSHWLFSGRFNGIANDGTVDTSTYQQQNKEAQISSTEARIVRGETLDKLPWTARNVVVRAATAVGTLATGFQFLTTDINFLAGIASYGNSAIPALGLFWPDPTVARLNRISDFGFSTNHVVPKGTSDIIVAFFPIDRFLTADLKRLFKKDPAAFFNPTELIVSSNKERKLLLDILDRAGVFMDPAGASVPHFHTAAGKLDYAVAAGFVTGAVMHYKIRLLDPAAPLNAEELQLVNILNSVSLNNIRVLVGGIMTVDSATIPPVINSIVFADNAATRIAKGTYKATIRGTFLDGGTVSFIDMTTGNASAFLKAATPDKTSSDTQLTFSYTVADTGFSGDPAHAVTVTKTAADKAVRTSAPLAFDYNPPLPTLSGPPTVKFPAGTLVDARWKMNQSIILTLTGTALKGARAALTLAPPSDSSVISIPTITSGPSSSDTDLDVAMKLQSDIPTGTKLIFTVQTIAQDGTILNSNPEVYTVTY